MKTERGESDGEIVVVEINGQTIELSSREHEILQRSDTVEGVVLAFILTNEAICRQRPETVESLQIAEHALLGLEAAYDRYDEVGADRDWRDIPDDELEKVEDAIASVRSARQVDHEANQDELVVRIREHYEAARGKIVDLFQATGGIRLEIVKSEEAGGSPILTAIELFLDMATPPHLASEESLAEADDLEEEVQPSAEARSRWLRTDWGKIVGLDLARDPDFMSKVYDALREFAARFDDLAVYRVGKRTDYAGVIEALEVISVQDAISAFTAGSDRMRYLLAFAVYRGTGEFVHPDDERIGLMEAEIHERFQTAGKDSDFACASIVEIAKAILDPNITITQVMRGVAPEVKGENSQDDEQRAVAEIHRIIQQLQRAAKERNFPLDFEGHYNGAQLSNLGLRALKDKARLTSPVKPRRSDEYTFRDMVLLVALAEVDPKAVKSVKKKLERYYDQAISAWQES